ncbi:uncharacterized protein DS421_18g623440 [Arachis hypogaea]|nr:uncharacterized protein DS421_18g623440 [Arachis hypogaea]
METKKRRESNGKMGLKNKCDVPPLSALGVFIPKKKNSYVQLKTKNAERAALLQPPKHTLEGGEAGNSSSMSLMSGRNKTTLNTLSHLEVP